MGKPKKSKTTNSELNDNSTQINKRKTRFNDVTVEPRTDHKIEPTKKMVKLNKSGLPNKKIIFNDDDNDNPEESTGSKTIEKPTKKKEQNFQDEEAEVKDEDIDKFCDELDEEDNVQFEDWVKQIEEKLHSNKKKT